MSGHTINFNWLNNKHMDKETEAYRKEDDCLDQVKDTDEFMNIPRYSRVQKMEDAVSDDCNSVFTNNGKRR